MALIVPKQQKETSIRLIYRFMKKMRASGILLEARKRQFYLRPMSRSAQKASALRRGELEKEYEQLKKSGKV